MRSACREPQSRTWRLAQEPSQPSKSRNWPICMARRRPIFCRRMRQETEDLLVVLHRVLPEIEQAPQTKREVGRILDLYREGAGLRGLLDQTSEQTVPNYESKVSSAGDAIRQGEVVAQEERRRLRLGIAPIVNAAETISEQGVWTAATDLPDGLSGLFVNHPSIGLAILVNASHRPVRRRFSYAHEYAHALFDRGETVTTTSSQNSTQLAEKRANAFAAAFLMPAEGVADHLRQLDKGSPSRHAQTLFDVANDAMMETEVRTRPGSQAITYQDVASLARRFGVSYEAAAWRLKSLGHIGVGETNALLGQKDTGNRYMRELGFRGSLRDGEDQRTAGTGAARAAGAARRRSLSSGRDLSRPSHRNRQKAFPRPFSVGPVCGSDARGLMSGSSDGAFDRHCRHIRSH